MSFETRAELLDYILNEMPSEAEGGVTFDYDDENDGVAYITTRTKEFKITITEEA